MRQSRLKLFFFFFQAEDGIRDHCVTGVQTCALPICFLEFITEEAKRYPNFRLVMGARVEELLEEKGVVRGVRYRRRDGWHEIRATLTVGTDGRFSKVRKLAGFEPIKTSSPIDVLWFRISRREDDPKEALAARVGSGLFLVFINRFDYWQVGCTIVKGSYKEVRAAG